MSSRWSKGRPGAQADDAVNLATMIVAWAALAVAHVGFGPAIASGAAAGLVAELAVEAWWRRRER